MQSATRFQNIMSDKALRLCAMRLSGYFNRVDFELMGRGNNEKGINGCNVEKIYDDARRSQSHPTMCQRKECLCNWQEINLSC